jgi:6-phosphogluconolactonase
MQVFYKKIVSSCAVLITLNSFAQDANLLVGTYTQKGSKGIYVCHFDTATGKAIELSHTNNISNPSFLSISKDHQTVYAVNEDIEGGVSSFSFKNNNLKLLQQIPTKGAHPCYITISPDQKNVFVANYTGGNIVQFYRFADGRLSTVRQLIQHVGSGLNKERQEKAHVHGAFFNPEGNYLFTPDLGMDQITAYPYKASANPVLQADKAIVLSSTPGAGPRHISFSKNGKLLYAIEELTGTVTVFQFEKSKVTKLQTLATHPDDFKGQPGSADIHLSPDGKNLYVSNRGSENNITKLEVLENGLLNTKNIHYFSTKGSKPRNFTISNDGKWLLVANQDTDNIVVFKIDPATGDLKDTGNQIKVSMPVCLVLF